MSTVLAVSFVVSGAIARMFSKLRTCLYKFIVLDGVRQILNAHRPWMFRARVYALLFMYLVTLARLVILVDAIYGHRFRVLYQLDPFFYYYAIIYSDYSYQLLTCFLFLVVFVACLHSRIWLSYASYPNKSKNIIAELVITNFNDLLVSNSVLWHKLFRASLMRNLLESFILIRRLWSGKGKRIKFAKKLPSWPIANHRFRKRACAIQYGMEIYCKITFFLYCKLE